MMDISELTEDILYDIQEIRNILNSREGNAELESMRGDTAYSLGILRLIEENVDFFKESCVDFVTPYSPSRY